MRSSLLQAIPDLERLGKAIDPLPGGGKRPSVRLVFALGPPRADAEIDAAAGDVVDRDRLLEQKCRIAVGVPADQHAEAQALGEGRQRGEHRVGLVRRVHDVEEPVEVVDQEETIEAEHLRLTGARQQLRPRRALPEHDPELRLGTGLFNHPWPLLC